MVRENKRKIGQFIKKEKKITSTLGIIDVKEKIGEGGNAIVYNAQFGKSQVALKVLAEENGSSKYNRLITEFREIVQLAETRAVVPIYYFGHLEIDGTQFPYILMKKYPRTLKKWKEGKEFSTFSEINGTFEKLLNAISVIHKNNIVHRDLKPENILIGDNDEIVLADFGISWFDPEFYERFVHTRKSDRMANYDFSAPEQFEKDSQPHPTMDIFALGQIITWLITGGVARGSRTPLTAVDKSFVVIESVINKMLSRSPVDRPQSIEEVRNIVSKILQEVKEESNAQKEINRVIGELREFNDVLLFCFPGKRGFIETNNPKKINNIMTRINNLIGEVDLWWTQGFSNSSINRRIYKIYEDTWVMDSMEMKIEKVWALKNSYSLDHQFLLIKTKPMPHFGIYAEVGGVQWEEAAWYKDRYITREEYDDGVADIDGESVLLD
ncbi:MULTISPECIES: serine/threonine-protein kinase [Sporosarcina]|uniref:Serine/threonine protein kinase n=1 Tax=Sporosarcina newyorkensis TaxID=759851 RepID=A0A1T4Y2J8_9BACL|nr:MULTISPECIES: serine/threonine-protein kinase [Sporosarcina]MBY0223485.1 serine/threonine protein kinase [Sporosarcina aquimarina]SKA95708.1 serine/threonine protein kinase [Sporosarcina newyorkensis]